MQHLMYYALHSVGYAVLHTIAQKQLHYTLCCTTQVCTRAARLVGPVQIIEDHR